MRKRIFAVTIVCLFLIPSFSGCKSKDDTDVEEYPVTIEESTIKRAPKKVAVLTPSIAEIIVDMGYGNNLVARGELCSEPKKVAELPSVGSTFSPDIEVLKGLKIDLVITQSSVASKVKKELETEGVPVIIIPVAKTLEEMENTFLTLGEIFFGKTSGKEQGELHFKKFSEKLDETKEKAEQNSKGAKVSGVYVADKFGHVATGDTMVGELLEIAGVDNLAKSQKNWKISEAWEEISKSDVIFCDKGIVDLIKEKKELSQSEAILYGRVYGIDGSILESQSFRIFSVLENIVDSLNDNIHNPTALVTEATTTATTTANTN